MLAACNVPPWTDEDASAWWHDICRNSASDRSYKLRYGACHRRKAPTMKTSEPRTLVTHPELRSHQSLPYFKALGEPPKSLLERLLSVFADVRAGEGVGTLLLALNIFLLLAGYSVMRPARDGLILSEGGAVAASYSAAAQAVLLTLVVPFYGWLGTRVDRIRLISITMTFFSLTLVGFWAGGTRRAAGRRRVLYLDRTYQRLHRVAVLGVRERPLHGRSGAPAVSLHRRRPVARRMGRRRGGHAARSGPQLHALHADAPGCGLPDGGAGASRSSSTGARPARAEPEAAAASVATARARGRIRARVAGPLSLLDRGPDRPAQRRQHDGQLRPEQAPRGRSGRRYGSARSERAGRTSRQFMTAFSGSISATVNLVGFLLQLFVTSRVIRFMGVRGALFILPVLALINYSIIAVAPILAVVRIGKILENSTDYSIQNTLRQALFLPTSREAKYKAKAAIDTFFTRAGDVISAGFVATRPGDRPADGGLRRHQRRPDGRVAVGRRSNRQGTPQENGVSTRWRVSPSSPCEDLGVIGWPLDRPRRDNAITIGLIVGSRDRDHLRGSGHLAVRGGKAARDALFLARLDVTSLPAMVIATSIFSILLVAVNAKGVSRLSPAGFVPWAFAVSAVLLDLSSGRSADSSPTIVPVRGLPAHIRGSVRFWGRGSGSSSSECFDPRTAKRSFGQIVAAGTIGGLLGGLLAERVAVVARHGRDAAGAGPV